MTADDAIRQAWDALLAEHRELVSAYLEALGMPCAPNIARQVRAMTSQVTALAELLALPLEGEG